MEWSFQRIDHFNSSSNSFFSSSERESSTGAAGTFISGAAGIGASNGTSPMSIGIGGIIPFMGNGGGMVAGGNGGGNGGGGGAVFNEGGGGGAVSDCDD